MTNFTRRTRRFLFALAVAGACVLPGTFAQAQEPQAQPTIADLMKMINNQNDKIQAQNDKIQTQDAEIQQLKKAAAVTPSQYTPAPGAAQRSSGDFAMPMTGGIQADQRSENAKDPSPQPLSPAAGERGWGEGGELRQTAGPDPGGVPGLLQGTPPSGFTAGWNEGFFIQSPSRDFVLRLTGQIQADYRDFLNAKDQTDIEQFLIRRARLGIEAEMFKYYEFRLLPDFAQGQMSKSYVQDAYMNVHYWDCFQVELGRFKQPFSYEELIQDRFVPTVERSMLDLMTPQRDNGVMLHGQKLFNNRLDWAIAVSDGELYNANVSTNPNLSNNDQNNHKDLNGRLVLRPFGSPESAPFLQHLQFGISAGFGIEQEPVSPTGYTTPATVPWFKYNTTATGVVAAGERSRWSPEIVYFYGPFGFAAQYMRMEQELRLSSSASKHNEITSAFYVMGTYLLTGEERTTYSMPITPLRNFDPCHPIACPGAGNWWHESNGSTLATMSSLTTLPTRRSLIAPPPPS